jgi:hypothetical protein
MNEDINKDEEKPSIMDGLSLTKVSDIIDSLIEKEDMKELKILKDRIIKYKGEVENKIKENKVIEHESFKKNLFKNLEKNLFYAVYIKDPFTRKEKIRKTYLWFFEKLQKWNSLDKIKYRTDKNVDEKYKPEEIASDDIIIKDDEYELKEFHLHRTDIPGLEPPKQRLLEYKTKQVKPPARFKKDQTTMDNLRFNIDRFHGRVGSACYMVQMKPDQFYSKTGNLWLNPTNIPVNMENNPINPRKEIKSAYSFNRPEYQLAELKIEKKIMEAKNIEMREKRNQEEIKKFMDEAAMAKAKFKEKREIKFNIDNIVKEYEKTFKTDKTADQLIDEQKAMEENNKDSKINEFKNINLSYKKGGISNKSNNLSSDENLTNNKNNNNIDMNTDNKNSPTKKVDLDKISSKFPNCYTNINNKVIYSKIENKDDFAKVEEEILSSKNEENPENKDEFEEEKKIIIKKDILPPKEEKKFKLTLKANKTELFEKIKNAFSSKK